MEKVFDHNKHEGRIYELWESSGAFGAPRAARRPFTILMPPPNANASLHAGHAMYTVDDIVLRFKRMQGFAALWIPGMDHAGFETQVVYERELNKKGKSRLDFDRKTLYEDIYKFVQKNSGLIYSQFKRLGFSADWEHSVFTLDENTVRIVYKTFKKMHVDGLVYRDDYIVNYCTNDGTTLADLEIKYVERKDPLYYLKYGPFTIATVRPETKFGDTAVAVHPDDKRYKKWIGREIEVEGLSGVFKMKVVGDRHVDPKFGTGVVKVTPAHDPNDFEVGKRHNLAVKSVIDMNGKLNESAGKYKGLSIRQARKAVVEDLGEKGLLVKVDEAYEHSVATCYRCGCDIEPLVMPNWFIKVETLKEKAKRAVAKDEVRFTPKRHKRAMLQWLDIMHDWPISRQIVWGIRIPVWYEIKTEVEVAFIDKNKKRVKGKVSELLKTHQLEEIKRGLQTLSAPADAKFVISDKSPGKNYLPETDTFDTWFSSGQWPIVTNPPNYPTDFIGTYSDILKFWVSRMIMFGIYLRGDVPFREVYLWSVVADKKGKKMSKSKGNVVDPIEMVDKYGADALRMSLVFGTATGGKIIFSEDKVRAMRNFANKIWNIARFVKIGMGQGASGKSKNKDDELILKQLNEVIKTVTDSIEKYRLNQASEALYDFVWHKFADVYIERSKNRREEAQGVLEEVLSAALVLLHPFMPFVTETLWQEMFAEKRGLLVTQEWPEIQQLNR